MGSYVDPELDAKLEPRYPGLTFDGRDTRQLRHVDGIGRRTAGRRW